MGKLVDALTCRYTAGLPSPEEAQKQSRSDGSLKGYTNKGLEKIRIEVFSAGLQPLPGSPDEESWREDVQQLAATVIRKTAQERILSTGFAVTKKNRQASDS